MNNMDVVAHCGLYCKSCSVYIASQNNDIQALEFLAKKMNTTKEEMYCDGCRSKRLSIHCRNCDFRNCTSENEVENCEDCNSFPCEKLKDFQTKMPHRIELFESAIYRKQAGLDRWFEKMNSDYACKVCGSLNSPYFMKCKKCNNIPGNNYIERNLEKIKKYFKID